MYLCIRTSNARVGSGQVELGKQVKDVFVALGHSPGSSSALDYIKSMVNFCEANFVISVYDRTCLGYMKVV